MSAFYFGPLGAMLPLVVSAGVPVQTGRGFSEFVTSGGVRYVQTGRAAPRTWTIGRQWHDPRWARMLSLAAHGLLPEAWLYDVAAARQNMLPASASVGSGDMVQAGSIPMGAVPVGAGPKVLLLAGRTVIISVWTTADAGQVVLTGLHGSTTLTLTAPPGVGARYAYTAFMPRVDGVLALTVVRVATALRVHEGPPSAEFHAAHGTPCRVAVQDPEVAYQMVTEQTRSDFTVTLLEVGSPGPA